MSVPFKEPTRTVKRTTPAYLNGLEWDDPEVVGAFNRLMDWFLAQVPTHVTVAAISVGNEVDLYLEGEPSWKRYSHFVEFLATLGLRHADGTDKPAWKQIVAETRMRGWD